MSVKKKELRINDSGINFRTESQELILPFFEKEPDWDKFHIYEWPDGRIVYEINLANKEMVLSSEFKENMPQANPQETVIQNIMFVENRENGRYDPVIARYYPADEYSVSGFHEISYNKIGAGWSGTVDIWTYDERHFIGFNIKDGQMVSTVKYDTGPAEGARTSHGQNYLTNDTVDCFRVPTTTTYTYTTTGYYETTVTATQHYATICSTGGSSGSEGNSWPTYEYNSGGGGGGGTSAPNEQPYTPPVIKLPSIFNAITNPCASRLFIQSTKNNNFNFTVPAQIGNLNPAIISLFQQTTKYPYLIKNGDLLNASDKYNVIITNSNFKENGRTKPRSFNETTGKFDIMIELSNDYLSKATQLSIVRTIIHESIHAYLLHEQYTNPHGDLYSGVSRYIFKSGITDPNRLHHEFMPQFIDAIAYSLWSWDMAYGSKGQIPLSYMKDLAWGGMTSYKDKNGVIKYYDSFKERFPNSNDRNRIERNINNEIDGNWSAKGKKCS